MPSTAAVRGDRMSDTARQDADRHPVTRMAGLPDRIGRQASVSRPDYADAFVTRSPSAHTWPARSWVRHVLQEAPLGTRAGLVAGWVALGLKVAPGRRDAVLGWAVHRMTHDHVVLGLDSVLGLSAELVFARDQDAWWFGTVLSVRTPAARAAWSAVEPAHVRFVPALLADAAVRADAGTLPRNAPE
jgi:hypothetical protein